MSRPGFKRLDPFNPTQLSGCQLWLDGADPNGTGILPSNGATVSTWKDKSTANNSVTLTSSTYSLNSTTGQYGIYFNSNPSSAVTLTPYMSFFVSSYANINFTSSFPGVFGTGVTSGYVFMFGYNGGAGNFMGAGGGIGCYATNTFGNFSSDARNMVVSESFCTPPNSFNMKIGAGDYNGNFWLGHIYEVIVYNAALTQSQYQNVEAYLAQKWGMKSFFPQSHVANTAIIYPNPRRTATAALQLPYYTIFSPLTIAGCALWLDASDATSYTNTGGVITSWKDKVATITTTAAKGSGPSLSNINGLNALYFNAGANIMLVNVTQSRTNRTFFMVLTSIVNSGAYIWPSSDYGLEIQGRNATELSFADQNVANIKFSPSFPSLGTQYIASIAYAGATNTQFYINGSGTGTDGGQTTSSTLSSDNTHYIGGNLGGYAASFILGEIIEYNVTLGTTQRQQIESYLAQKWGISSYLPSNHINNTTPAGLPAVVQEVYGKPKRIMNPLTLKDFPQSTTFTYTTGVYQYYTVPAGITSVTVLMWGAGGGGVSGYNGWNGGGGACIQGTLSVTPGETLTIVVGRGAATSQTGTPTDAMGGGGPGYNNARGYGGGRSAIQRTEGTDIVTVGGGGGSGYGSNLPGGRGRGGAATGSGQACAGGNQNRSGTGDYGQGGEGGTQTRGGVGGTWISTGSSGTKGFGGSSPCGGGGGGWYGGGGGGGPFTAGEDGPGGGGSSYTGNLTSVTTWDASTNTAGNTGSSSWNGYGSGGSYVTTGGHGAVIITYYVSRLG